MRHSDVKTFVFAGVFIALTILLTYVFSLQTPFVRISFGFLPVAVYATLFGPARGALMAAAADILGTALFMSGAYFPGFTGSALLSGLIYGYFLHGHELTWQRIALPFISNFLLIDLGLNTFWLTLLYHQAAWTFVLSRFIKGAIFLPIHILLFGMIWRPLALLLPRWHLKG